MKTLNSSLNSAIENDFPEDNEALFKELTSRPFIAWPTVVLLVFSFALFGCSSAAYLMGDLSVSWAIALNALASYLAFTPMHDASHNALSTNRKVNENLGRVATLLLLSAPVFKLFRYIHMQHHRFANDAGKDPDMYCGGGRAWTLPLRWATLDLSYFYRYLKPSLFKSRPKAEQREFIVAALFGAALIIVIVSMGWFVEYLLLFLIPSRIAVFFLALAFDFLPHYPHQEDGKNNPYQATINRVGMEWLLTPALLSQNYHLVHHLYPTVPFYRYIQVWRAKERFHRSQNPALTSAFGLAHRKTL